MAGDLDAGAGFAVLTAAPRLEIAAQQNERRARSFAKRRLTVPEGRRTGLWPQFSHIRKQRRPQWRKDRAGWLGRKDSDLGIPKVYLFELSNEFAAL